MSEGDVEVVGELGEAVGLEAANVRKGGVGEGGRSEGVERGQYEVCERLVLDVQPLVAGGAIDGEADGTSGSRIIAC